MFTYFINKLRAKISKSSAAGTTGTENTNTTTLNKQTHRTTFPRTYTAFAILFTILLIVSFYKIHQNFGVWAITNLILVVPIFLIWQTFIFFYKTYSISKYTTANQTFWKRALFIFWALEVFLFLITVFIWFNAPSNLVSYTGHAQVVKKYLIDPDYLTKAALYTVTILILLKKLIMRKRTEKGLIIMVILATIISAIIQLIKLEFNQFLEILYRTTNKIAEVKRVNNTNNMPEELTILDTMTKEDLPATQTLLLITFLKFWHILFIGLFILFKILRCIDKGELSHDALSAMYYNAMFLIFFYSIPLLYISRKELFFFLDLPTVYLIFKDPMSIINFIIYIIWSIIG